MVALFTAAEGQRDVGRVVSRGGKPDSHCGRRPPERAPLFQSVNSVGTEATGRALNRYNAWAAIRKRAKAAGFLTPVGCHTWRATGITIFLENDGRLEHAQQMAGMNLRNNETFRRTKDEITFSEVERA